MVVWRNGTLLPGAFQAYDSGLDWGRKRIWNSQIAIMGTGAVGGYAGAHMAQAGHDVTFIDPWPEHVERMRSHGLRISHVTGEEFTTPVRALHLTDAQHLAKEKPIDITLSA